MRALVCIVVAVVFVGCPGPQPADEETHGLSAAEIGLSKADVLDTPVPAAANPIDASPGENDVLPRAHAEAPPVIPHAVDGFLPITREDNSCIYCHGEEGLGAPVIPETHFIDLRSAPGKVRESVAGSRWVCLSCHVAQTDAVPLVANEFGS